MGELIVTETNQNEIDIIVSNLLKKEPRILEIRLVPDKLFSERLTCIGVSVFPYPEYFYREKLGILDFIKIPSSSIQLLQRCVPDTLRDKYRVDIFTGEDGPFSFVSSHYDSSNQELLSKVRKGILLYPFSQEETKLLFL